MFGLNPYVLGGVGLLFAGMAGTIWWQHHENGQIHETIATVSGERDQAVKVNADNVVELAAIRVDTQRAIAAMAHDNAVMQQRARRATTLKQEIARATPSESVAVVGPVLGRLLGRMRGTRPAGDQDPTGAAGDPVLVPVVQP